MRKPSPHAQLVQELFEVAHRANFPHETHDFKKTHPAGHSRKAFPALARYVAKHFKRR